MNEPHDGIVNIPGPDLRLACHIISIKWSKQSLSHEKVWTSLLQGIARCYPALTPLRNRAKIARLLDLRYSHRVSDRAFPRVKSE